MHNAQGIITRVKGQAGAGWGQLRAGVHVKQGSLHTKDVGVVRYKQQQQPRKQSEHMHIYYTYFAHASGQAGAGSGQLGAGISGCKDTYLSKARKETARAQQQLHVKARNSLQHANMLLTYSQY